MVEIVKKKPLTSLKNKFVRFFTTSSSKNQVKRYTRARVVSFFFLLFVFLAGLFAAVPLI